jgi:hypothetical protein
MTSNWPLKPTALPLIKRFAGADACVIDGMPRFHVIAAVQNEIDTGDSIT